MHLNSQELVRMCHPVKSLGDEIVEEVVFEFDLLKHLVMRRLHFYLLPNHVYSESHSFNLFQNMATLI